MSKKEKPSEADYECNYADLLLEFNALWQKSPKDFTKFAALKNKANNSLMSFRQKDGIIERCNNVIKGDYGKTKAGITFYSSQEAKKQ